MIDLVYMTDNETMGESSHGMAEDVAADYLHDILRKFGIVIFDAFPFFICADTFVCYGFATEFILANFRFNIAEPSARWQNNE